MTKQPLPLRLADAIEDEVVEGKHIVGSNADCAAAELRRLHKAYENAITALQQAISEAEGRSIEQAEKQEPRNIRERWNIELDGDDLLVCFNDHEKSEGCRYERYVLADTSPPQRQLDQFVDTTKMVAQEQEPAGHFLDTTYCDTLGQVHVYQDFFKGQPFYASPPQRQPLTPESVFQIADQHPVEGFDPDIMAFARAIEAAHGIKGEA